MLLHDDMRWAHARGMVLPTVHFVVEPMLVGYCQDVTDQKRR